jgi:hypothetical protein
MTFGRFKFLLQVICIAIVGVILPVGSLAQTSSSSSKIAKKTASSVETGLDAGSVANGLYRNKSLGLTCKIPDGWVLRTEEMNVREEPGQAEQKDGSDEKASPTQGKPGESKVLLAAFSRPPEAKGEDVNSSIVIAAESVASYPGLKEAVQYMGPISDATKAQGFEMDEEPYGIAIGTTTVVRGDFHKNVGTRVMRQSTLALLSHGYAVSITMIGGTEDEVEELIDGLEFQGSPPPKRAPK